MSDSNIYAGVAGFVGRPNDVGAHGVFRRRAEGGAWEQVLAEHEAYAVFVHPDDPGLVFAGTADGVWRSVDRGASFRRADFPDAGRQVWSFLVSEGDPDRMYAGTSPIDVYRSEDRGASWHRLPNPGIKERCAGPFAPRVMRLAQRPGRAEEIYAALEIAGAMRTTDGGETWQDLSEDLVRLAELPHLRSAIVQRETQAEGMLDGHAIAISPAAPDMPIIALRMGLFRSRDGGGTWQDMEVGRFSPTTYGRDIRVSPQDPNVLYTALSVAADSRDGGVYRSTDAGETWQRFDRVQVNGTIMSIGLHPSDANQVYIGARYGGEVFGTVDGGETWQAWPLPGPVKDIYAVACG
ncbi:MAG: hypothetical protein QF578_04210 [Alphaproteobacteria bacterium]|jgi:hypothetical protein|nr:hypothetical protein [Alphaproteobacteria bacterium]MDP6564006.1 hypothetical protein [Alphaproteobacteria bacterium]MDP6814149.1 hypothetical protein [Alphaproteobacteria bacterium]